jgi:hypothetical protein
VPAVWLIRALNALGIHRRRLASLDLEELDHRTRAAIAAAGASERLLKEYASPWLDLRTTAAGAYLQALIAVTRRLPDLATIRIPVLALLSAGSTFSDPVLTRELLTAMAACTIVTLDARHWIPTEQPEAMRRAVEEWCRGLTGGRVESEPPRRAPGRAADAGPGAGGHSRGRTGPRGHARRPRPPLPAAACRSNRASLLYEVEQAQACQRANRRPGAMAPRISSSSPSSCWRSSPRSRLARRSTWCSITASRPAGARALTGRPRRPRGLTPPRAPLEARPRAASTPDPWTWAALSCRLPPRARGSRRARAATGPPMDPVPKQRVEAMRPNRPSRALGPMASLIARGPATSPGDCRATPMRSRYTRRSRSL